MKTVLKVVLAVVVAGAILGLLALWATIEVLKHSS